MLFCGHDFGGWAAGRWTVDWGGLVDLRGGLLGGGLWIWVGLVNSCAGVAVSPRQPGGFTVDGFQSIQGNGVDADWKLAGLWINPLG